MTNNTRTLNDFTVDELKGMITDLQSGVRYNDLKVKYSIPNFTFTPQTISQCKELIAQKSPKPVNNANLNTWYDESGNMHYGLMPQPDMPWTWTSGYREAVNDPEKLREWHRISNTFKFQFEGTTNAVTDESF